MSAALQIDFEIATATDPATPHQAAVIDAEAFLIRRLRAGDERAYATLTRTHGGRMLAVARRMLRHEADAQDVVQEAWLQAFRALPRFEGHARLATWLHRIVVNAALMKLRSQRRHPELSLTDVTPPGECENDTPDDESTSALEEIISHERRTLIRRVMERLPESHRKVILLRDFEDLDTEQTARRLGTTPGAVKTRLHRAHQALREAIELEHAATSGCSVSSLAELVA
jgi:RNA polymerase sigma-70 factor (ECF subfamily)